MNQTSFWVRNPDIRDSAIALDGQGKPIKEVIAALIKEYGEDAAPTPWQMSKLRMSVAAGKYRGREKKPISGQSHIAMAIGAVVCGREETLEKISPEGRNDMGVGRNDMNAGAEACRHQDKQATQMDVCRHQNQSAGAEACNHQPGQANQDKPTRIKKPYSSPKTYWDSHPSITRFAAKLIADEDFNIQDAIAQRFGEQFRPETWQIELFREGLETGRFTIKDKRQAAGLSEATLRLLSNEQAIECLVPGIRLWKRIHCIKRQLRFRVGQDERTWNDQNPNRQSKRVMVPQLAHCAKCVNWIPASDLRILRRKIQKGFVVEAANNEPKEIL